MNPYAVVKDFEAALCFYTGAKYAVTTNSCTMSILLALEYHINEERWISGMRVATQGRPDVWIPRFTYVSVPQSIIHAGGKPRFIDTNWIGAYQLNPYPVWDSARRFRAGMFVPGQMQCVSFHASKILGDTQGGAILHDNDVADSWLRKMRFDGRTEGVAPCNDIFTLVGHHCYMSNDVAARLLLKLSVLPAFNTDLPNDNYPDLSMIKVFK